MDSNNYQYRNEVSHEAYVLAIKRLSRAQRTVFEIRHYLYQKEFSEDVIDEVVERLTTESLLNDDAYVQEWLDVVAQNRGYGKMKIIAMLQKRGVSSEDIDRGYQRFYRDIEFDILTRVADRKLRTLSGERFEVSQKLGRFLSSRGFLESDIREYLESFLQ